MLNPKQKAYLRGLANHLEPVFQIGKEGISLEMMEGISLYLAKHELMKVNMLANSTISYEEASNIFEGYHIEVVQIIGHIIVLYKHSSKAKEPIVLPKSKK